MAVAEPPVTPSDSEQLSGTTLLRDTETPSPHATPQPSKKPDLRHIYLSLPLSEHTKEQFLIVRYSTMKKLL